MRVLVLATLAAAALSGCTYKYDPITITDPSVAAVG